VGYVSTLVAILFIVDTDDNIQLRNIVITFKIQNGIGFPK